MQHSFTRPHSPPPYTETNHRGQHVPGRDPDFWFEDGNVVVIADNTSFRIHRSVLARHSDLLTDRMGSHDDRRDTTSDGCPIVRIADSASIFKGLLSLLVLAARILRHVASDRVLPRVTHKYLHGLLPATFDEWKRREDRALSLPRSTPPPAQPSLHTPTPNPDMIGVLTALRQIHADDLLPIALYLCAQLPPRVLLAGIGSGAERLSRGDVERCLVLRAALAKHAARMAMRLFAEPLQCHRCRGAVEETFAAVVEGQFEDAPRTDPLGAYWRRQLDGGPGGRGSVQGDHEKGPGPGLRALCARCVGVLRERDEEQRRELWDELPRLVGF